MRSIALALLLSIFAGGCAETVTGNQFLLYYRQSLPVAGTGHGMAATYTGREGGYHYLEVRQRTRMSKTDDLMLFGAFRDKTYRCREEELPRDFPEGFLRAFEEGASNESREASQRYIDNYMYTHGR